MKASLPHRVELVFSSETSMQLTVALASYYSCQRASSSFLAFIQQQSFNIKICHQNLVV